MMPVIQAYMQYNDAVHRAEVVAVEWQTFESGSESDIASLSRRTAEVLGLDWPPPVGRVFNAGALRLRVISDVDWAMAECRVMRDGWAARVRALWFPVWLTLEIAYGRTIITLGVWGLARTREGAIPSWRDVHALRKAIEWVQRWMPARSPRA